jgi:pantetheine-phosphate adenylyltransferase
VIHIDIAEDRGVLRGMGKAIYPGSFDPVTLGHLDIIKRTSAIMEHLLVAVLDNPRKQAVFTLDERVEMLRRSTASFKNVSVDFFQGLLIDYSKMKNIPIIIKGLRAISDFEFEFQMALVNRKLNPNMETVFIMTNSKYSYLSSSIVREVASFGGEICDLVPREVYDMVKGKFVK